MYFVSRGYLSIIGNTGEVLNGLTVGGFFGEVSLITGKRRTAHVRAETFCTLAVLDKPSFEDVMLRHPEQLEIIIRNMSTQQKRWITNLANGDGSSSDSGPEDSPAPRHVAKRLSNRGDAEEGLRGSRRPSRSASFIAAAEAGEIMKQSKA